jgi:hypothetical protein
MDCGGSDDCADDIVPSGAVDTSDLPGVASPPRGDAAGA